MRGAVLVLLTTLAAAPVAVPAAANDTMAVGAAGGLEFRTSADVAILSEDLDIASDGIRVRYVFENRTDRPVESLVAFPLPDVDHASDRMMIPAEGLPADNFVGFTVTVDGTPVTAELVAQAVVGDRDVTALLRHHGIPLSQFHRHPAIDEVVEVLPDSARTALTAAGALGPGEMGDHSPQWTLRTAYVWTQVFPPRRPLVVEHRYVPVVGGDWVLAEDLADGGGRWGDRCLGASQRAAVAPLLEPHGAARATLIDYVLGTGANWAGPIGRFRLTIDQGRADRVLAVCLDGLRRSGRTTWTWEREAFEPDGDLRILLVEPPPAD